MQSAIKHLFLAHG